MARFVRLLFQRLERRHKRLAGRSSIARMNARQGLLATAEVATVLWEAFQKAKKTQPLQARPFAFKLQMRFVGLLP